MTPIYRGANISQRAVKKLNPFYKHTQGHRRAWVQCLQKPRVQLMLPVKAMLLSAPSSPPANVLYHPQDGCRLVHASSELRLRVSFIRKSRLHFGGLCHTAGLRQKAGNNMGTQAETFCVPLEGLFFFFFPSFSKSIPPPKRKANTMLISSREISHTFSPATDQGAKPI